MARAGDIIDNPVTGERMRFIRTARETGGELLEAELELAPRAQVAAAHVHPHQEERMTVIEGEVLVSIDGAPARRFRAGETAVIGPGHRHAWWNAADMPAKVRGEFRPAGKTAEFFESFFALAHDRQTDAQGKPSLLRLAVMAPAFDIWLASPPRWVQRTIFALLAPIARARRYRAIYQSSAATAA